MLVEIFISIDFQPTCYSIYIVDEAVTRCHDIKFLHSEFKKKNRIKITPKLWYETTNTCIWLTFMELSTFALLLLVGKYEKNIPDMTFFPIK